MKITCDFCKTEYSMQTRLSGPVQCAVCGHVWNVRSASPRDMLMVVAAATCALLAAAIFAFVVIFHHQATQTVVAPLDAPITDVHSVIDAAGLPHFVVTGYVINQTDEIYAVPDLIIVSYDEDGRPVGRQKFLSPATLLDPGAMAGFSHTLSSTTHNVKNIKVEFDTKEMGL